MNSGLVVGIDAGATKTRAFAVDSGGAVVGRGAGGGAKLHAAAERRGAPTRMTALLFQELGATEFGDVLPQLYGKPHPAPAVMAAMRALAAAAGESDALAVGILQRGAVALARAATVVAQTLSLQGGPLYLSGGAFESLPTLQQLVRLELLHVLPRATVEPVREEPAMGAARIAMELAWSTR